LVSRAPLQVEAGLARIKALDAKLADKETEAMLMTRCVRATG